MIKKKIQLPVYLPSTSNHYLRISCTSFFFPECLGSELMVFPLSLFWTTGCQHYIYTIHEEERKIHILIDPTTEKKMSERQNLRSQNCHLPTPYIAQGLRLLIAFLEVNFIKISCLRPLKNAMIFFQRMKIPVCR